MGFNELNSVEHYIIHRLSDTNLNSKNVAEPSEGYGSFWKYKSANELQRNVNEVLEEVNPQYRFRNLVPF